MALLTDRAVPALSKDAWDELLDAIRNEFAEVRTFFLTGAGRSGTTSCARILGEARNATTVTEPAPNLALEVDAYRQGRVADPRPVIWRSRIERMRRVLDDDLQYGEKDLKTFCWLPFYRELFNPRFVLVLRDGREAVASLLGWHYDVHGNVYLEAPDERPLAPEAAARRAGRARADDLTERGRPRPRPGDPAYDGWSAMSRREMLAWYWAHVTRVAQRDLYRMEDDRWTAIDYSRSAVDAAAFARLYAFLGLDGFDEARVERLLAERINSFDEKRGDAARELAAWTAWSDDEMDAFDRHAAAAMVELGYYGLDRLPAPDVPATRRDDPVVAPARASSPALVAELAEIIGSSGRGGDARVLGIGAGVEHLPGVAAGQFESWDGGPIESMPQGEFDLVCALGVLDRCADMDRFLVEVARRTAGRLLVTASRGHFPERIDHRYEWSRDGAPRHEWCVARSRSLLRRQLGFATVRTGVVASGEPARPQLAFLYAERA